MLSPYFDSQYTEAGCDEAGRGCLAGPVVAAAVILPKSFNEPLLNDSKKLSEKQRNYLKSIIEKSALSYAVAFVSPEIIDEMNILNASIYGMHLALQKLTVSFDLILVDGNRFKPYNTIPHHCIIKGDGKYQSIAAASVLAKTYRDAYMKKIAREYPMYQWEKNKGYPTKTHRSAIENHGITPHHRRSFRLLPEQMKLF